MKEQFVIVNSLRLRMVYVPIGGIIFVDLSNILEFFNLDNPMALREWVHKVEGKYTEYQGSKGHVGLLVPGNKVLVALEKAGEGVHPDRKELFQKALPRIVSQIRGDVSKPAFVGDIWKLEAKVLELKKRVDELASKISRPI